MSDSPHFAYRHFYTVAAEGSLGHPGFQTVACSPALEPVLAELERRVGGFKDPDGRGGTSSRRQLPSRQLALMGDPDFYALTTFTPRGQGPDGRDGNYFAETLVVPAAWLADGGWDAAAAFASLVWQGPAAAQECSGWPCPLQDHVPLPVLQPTPYQRLARLREGVPGELLPPLVAAVARLTQRRQPVRLVEAAGGGPVPVGELVELLPLVLPPACRSFEDGDARRTFQLCTRSHPDAPFPVDLSALPSRHLDAVAAGSDFVVDLGERRPVENVRERFAKDYAAWFQEVLTAGDWQRLAELWKRAETAPGAAFFAAFPKLLQEMEAEQAAAAAAPAFGGEALQPAASAPREAGDDDAPADSLVGRRRAVWTTQAQVEAFLVRQHAERQGELKELLGLLQEDAAGSQERLLDTLARERAETARRLADERQALTEAMRDERERTAEELRRSVEGVGRDALESLRREASSIRGAARSELETTIRDLQRVLARQRGPGAASSRFRDFRPWQVAAGLALFFLVLATVAGLLYFGLPGSGAGGANGVTGAAAQTAGANGEADGGPGDPSASALAALAARGPVAAALLARAADPAASPAVDAATRDAAAALYLDLLLDDDPPRNDGLRVRLMQAALGVGVDGDPGPGTRTALDAANAGTCCTGLSEQGQAHCFLARRLKLDENPCTGAVLFAAGAEWSFGEASRLLALVRETVAAIPAGSNNGSTYRDLLHNLDLAAAAPGAATQRAAAVAGLTPDGAETAGLLRLARAVATGRTWDDVSGQPGDAERRQVAALLRGLAADGGGPAP